MDLKSLIGKQIGKVVEKAVVNILSDGKDDDDDDDKKKGGGGILSFLGDDKDDDKEKGGGGFLSFLGGDKEKDDGGLFSFGRDDEKKKDKKDDDDNGFFSSLLNRDDDDDKTKRSGFKGLFNEQQGAADCPGDQEGGEATLTCGGSGVSGDDLLSDLMDVAEEHSQGQ